MAVDGRLNFDTKIDTKGFSKGVSGLSNQINYLKSVVVKLGAAIGVAFGVAQIVAFGKASVTAANQTSNAWQGLQSIMDGQGRSFTNAKAWIQDYVSDGLIPLQNAVTAYKNLAARGYDDSQIKQVLTALKDSSAYGRQASYSMGEAVQTATEGLKNENSILVDNAGVTQNVAKMWDDYAKSIGTTAAKLTQQQKIQAEVNGIMTETRFQTGDAAKVANSFSGQLSRLVFNFNELKVAVGNLLKAVLQPVIVYLNSALTGITALAKSAAKLLGITTDVVSGSAALSDGSSDAASNYDDMAKSAENAAKATENSLASFDKITKLGDSKSTVSAADTTSTDVGALSGGKISAAADIDTSYAERKLADFFNGVKKSFSEFFKPFKNAWDKHGTPVVDSAKKALKNVLSLIDEIGGSFKEVWTNGSGERIVGHILDIFTNINKTIGNIADRLKTAWTTDNLGTDIIQHTADIFDTILGHVDNITGKISKWADTLDFEPLLTSFDTLLKALEPFADNVGEGLEWFFDNVLLPLASWTIEDVIPTFLDLLSGAIDFLNSVIDAIQPQISWLFDNFLKPIAEWTGGVVVSVLENLAKVLKKIGTWISENQTAFQVITGIVAAFFAVWEITTIGEWIINAGGLIGILGKLKSAITAVTTAKIADKIESIKIIALYAKDFVVSIGTTIAKLAKETAAWIANKAAKLANAIAQATMTAATVAWNAVCTIATAVTTAFGAAISFLTSPIGLIVLAIGALIAIGVILYKNWDTIKQFAIDMWDCIKDTMYSFYDWCVGIFDTVVAFFSDLWENIKNVFAAVGEWFEDLFSKAWDGIKSVFSAVGEFFAGIWDSICEVFSSVKEWFVEKFTAAWDGIKNAWKSVKEFFAGIWDGICEVFSSVKEWFGEKFSAAWNGIKSAFSAVGEFFAEVWKAVKKPFITVADWFKNIFSKAWEGVKNVFSKGGKIFAGIKEGISDVFFSVVNGLIDGINWVIAKPFQAINTAIGWIRGIDIFDWQPFSGLSEIDVPQIPKLAKGGLAYAPQLAMVGDNKNARTDPEVIAPLSKLEGMLGDNTELAALVQEIISLMKNAKQTINLYLSDEGIRALSKQIAYYVNDISDESGENQIEF